jgi:plastocyanin
MKRAATVWLSIGVIVLAGFVATRLLNSAAAGAAEQLASANIAVDNFTFAPREITVEKGTTVIWVNHDDVPHTIVSADKKFKSKALDTDDQYSFTFTEAGTYPYFCSVHPVMTGKVIVK